MASRGSTSSPVELPPCRNPAWHLSFFLPGTWQPWTSHLWLLPSVLLAAFCLFVFVAVHYQCCFTSEVFLEFCLAQLLFLRLSPFLDTLLEK